MDSVLFSIGNFEIKWYSVLILLAVLIGLFLTFRESKKFGISKDYIFNLIFWMLIAAFIGARLYYVIFRWDLYKDNLIDILKVWEGGLAIHGGIIAGFLAVLIYTKKYKVSTFKITDIIAPALLLGQAIGRWGNFFNGEAHGAETTIAKLSSLHVPDFVIKGMYIDGKYYQPTFFYESIWCVIGFIFLILIRRTKYIKNTQLTCIYLMWYSFGRFIIESMRTDSLLIGPFKMAQVISLVLFITGLIGMIIKFKKDKFEDLYNEIGNESNIRF